MNDIYISGKIRDPTIQNLIKETLMRKVLRLNLRTFSFFWFNINHNRICIQQSCSLTFPTCSGITTGRIISPPLLTKCDCHYSHCLSTEQALRLLLRLQYPQVFHIALAIALQLFLNYQLVQSRTIRISPVRSSYSIQNTTDI